MSNEHYIRIADIPSQDRTMLSSVTEWAGTPWEILPVGQADVIKFLCEKNSDDNYSGIIIQVR